MTEQEVDRHLGGTPCICGEVTFWHPECYAGKTKAEVKDAYRRVYAKIRRRLWLEGQAAAKRLISRMNSESPS